MIIIYQKYPKTKRLLEDDNEGYGLNAYNSKAEDP